MNIFLSELNPELRHPVTAAKVPAQHCYRLVEYFVSIRDGVTDATYEYDGVIY